MKISAINNSSLVELAEDSILEVIRRNKLSLGDSLPSEVTLTEKLGVSRPVVREALSRLRMLGLLESKKKRGLIIAEPDVFGGCKRVLDSVFLTEKTWKNLCEMRLCLELGIADFLFLRKTDEGLKELESLVERGETATSDTIRVKHEVEFHSKLYQMVNNDLLAQFRGLLQPFFFDAMKQENEGIREISEISHRDLLDELRSGTPEGFRGKMRLHLDPQFRRLAGMKLERPDE
jgi:DNA-binding FadR family transcriptional regulator